MLTKKYITKYTFLTILLCLINNLGYSQTSANEFSHAKFVDGKKSIDNLIKFPKIKDKNIDIKVVCNGQSTAKGRLRNAICSSPNDPDLEFTMAVSRRFNSTRLIPATVNGKSEEVDFQFIVHFIKVEELKEINIYINNGKNTDRLGTNYYSPQRYSPYVWPIRCRDWRKDDLIMEAAVIDTNGLPKQVNIVSAAGELPSSCKSALETQLKNARWIPAKHNNNFVESVWVNPIVLSSVEFKRQWKQQKSLN